MTLPNFQHIFFFEWIKFTTYLIHHYLISYLKFIFLFVAPDAIVHHRIYTFNLFKMIHAYILALACETCS